MWFGIILKGLPPVSLTVYYSIRQRLWEAIVWDQSLKSQTKSEGSYLYQESLTQTELWNKAAFQSEGMEFS